MSDLEWCICGHLKKHHMNNFITTGCRDCMCIAYKKRKEKEKMSEEELLYSELASLRGFKEGAIDGAKIMHSELARVNKDNDALRKQLEVVKTDLHDTTAQLVMDEEIEDMLRKQLEIAVEAIDDYTRNKSIYVLYKALAKLQGEPSGEEQK